MPYKDKEQGNARRRDRYRRYKQQGLCTTCGKPTLSDNSRCVSCVEKDLKKRKWRYSNPINRYKSIMRCKRYDSKHKQEKAKYDRIKVMVRIKEGKCPRCGVPLVNEEPKYCLACTTKTRPIKGVLKYETAD